MPWRRVAARLRCAGQWRWSATHLLTSGIIAAGIAILSFPDRPLLWPALWVSLVGTLGAAWWLALGAVLPGWTGVVLRVAAFTATALAAAWCWASVQLVLDQGRPLSAGELLYRLSDPPSRGVVLDLLWSGEAAIALVVFLLSIAAGYWLIGRTSRAAALRLTIAVLCLGLFAQLALGWQALLASVQQAQPDRPLDVPVTWPLVVLGLLLAPAALWLFVVTLRRHLITRQRCTVALPPMALFAWGLVVAGGGWLDERDVLDRQRTVAAPWSWLATWRMPREPGHVAIDRAAAAALRQRPDPACWSAGGDDVLGALAGRYAGRGVVVVFLESHRLSDVDRLGSGAHGHQPCSPVLSALAERSLTFANYVQPGLGTFYAQFSFITGLPPGLHFTVDGADGSAALASAGPLAELVRAGWTCEWLQATDTTFAGFDHYLDAAGVGRWFTPAELAPLDRSTWNSWGMPDGPLLTILAERIRTRAASSGNWMLAALTISNHKPYRFPGESRGLPQDHLGGMRYADRCLATLIATIDALPADRRPLLLVTADHGHRDRLADAQPLGLNGPEVWRLPGVLLLPDGALAGVQHRGMFTHEDVADLLSLLVRGPTGAAGSRKFLDLHRSVVATVLERQLSLVTPTAYLCAPQGLAVTLDGWRIGAPLTGEADTTLRHQVQAAEQTIRRIWPTLPTPR